MMEKNIKDYLHLYLGCEVSLVLGEFKLIGVESDGAIVWNKIYGRKIYPPQLIKPILRNLSDMTEEEAIIYFDLPKGVEILKRQIVRGRYLSFEYRWVHENPKLNIEDGFAYSESAIGFDGTKIDNYPNKILYLLKQGFDLFGLIESGLAIDKTKIQTNEPNKQ